MDAGSPGAIYNEPVGDASPFGCRHCNLLQRIRALAEVARAGLPFLAAVVVLTMLAAESFDPRLI